MRFTLKQLEVFLQTAHFENLSKAADALSMSQSAASESLKTLESQFDVALFDRIGKRLQLNEFGRLIQTQAEALLEQARSLEQTLLKHNDIGNIRVGATLSIGNYLAINILSTYRNTFKGADASLTVENTSKIRDKVLNFKLDIGLVEGEVNHPDLDVLTWRDDELVIFCSPDHPYAQLSNLEDSHLLDAEWVLREHGSGTRQAFDYAMHGLISKLNVNLELQHTEAIKRAVESGMGLGCLSEVTLEDSFKSGRLIRLNAPHRDFKRQFYFLLRKGKYLSHGITQWMNLCRDY